MKLRTIFAIAAVVASSAVGMQACPTCTPKNASPIDTIVHGATPQGPLDYVIAASMLVIVIASAVATVRAIVHREQLP